MCYFFNIRRYFHLKFYTLLEIIIIISIKRTKFEVQRTKNNRNQRLYHLGLYQNFIVMKPKIIKMLNIMKEAMNVNFFIELSINL